MSDSDLSTAETLVMEVLKARIALGEDQYVFPSKLWIRPQLYQLDEKGLLTWTYDEEGDYLVTPTPALLALT